MKESIFEPKVPKAKIAVFFARLLYLSKIKTPYYINNIWKLHKQRLENAWEGIEYYAHNSGGY